MDLDSKLIVKFYTSFFEKKVDSNEIDRFDDLIDYMVEETSEEFSEGEIIKGILWYYIEKNQNPKHILDFDDIFYYYRDDLIPILNEIGYHDKFNIFEDCDGEYYDTFINSNGEIFLTLDNFTDFSEIFDIDERVTIENVLDEDWFELFDMSYADINEFIDDIDLRSLMVIKEHIINNYLGNELDDGGVLTVEMLNDEDNLKHMIRNESSLEELKYDLERFYGDAYNITAEDELFNNFLNELKGFFGVSDIKYNDNNQIIINITDLYKKYSLEYLNYFLYLPCEDHGNFLDVISAVLDEDDSLLSLGLNLDYYYPDQYKLGTNLNEIIVDNIY